jgi:hypothetical protein
MVNVVFSTNVIHSARRFWVQQRRATRERQLKRRHGGAAISRDVLGTTPVLSTHHRDPSF